MTARGKKTPRAKQPAASKPASGKAKTLAASASPVPARKGTVAIVAMGFSNADYLRHCMSMGAPHKVADTIITINSAALAFRSDLVIAMDDMKNFEGLDEGIAELPKWARTCDVPIITSRPRPEYPTTKRYPLAEVTAARCTTWFNNSVAYAVSYADVILRAACIRMYGADFYMPEQAKLNQGGWEHGMACVVHHLSLFHANGGQIRVAPSSVLMDSCLESQGIFYGFDEQPHLEMHRGKPTAFFDDEAVRRRALAAKKGATNAPH